MERWFLRSSSGGLAAKLWRVNWMFVLLLCALATIGFLALYSAGGGIEPYAGRHALRFGFGLLLMLSVAMIDIRTIQSMAWPFYIVSLGLLVLVAFLGRVGMGAQRWIDLGVIQLQPSELMKIALVVVLASWFHKASWERVGNPLFLIVPIILVFVPAALILKQPNLGTAVITVAVGGAVFLAAGVRLWKFAIVTVAAAAAAPVAYSYLHDYQRARLITFLNPESDPLGAGYNIIQSRIALGSGGMWGKGFQLGTQGYLNFLPEKQTDFIFTVWAEEFGFVGSISVLALLLVIILWGMGMALSCRHQFGRLLSLGLVFNFFMYIAVNVSMVMGVIPVGGVPMPLVSHGGSAMITVMLGFGLLMSAYIHRGPEYGNDGGDS